MDTRKMKSVMLAVLAMLMWQNAVVAQKAEDVLEAARRVNDYFMLKWPDPKKDTFVKNRVRPSSLWTRGVYYEGLMALYGIDKQQRYLDYIDEWAEYHKWTPRYGTKTTHADDNSASATGSQSPVALFRAMLSAFSSCSFSMCTTTQSTSVAPSAFSTL